MTEPTNPPAPRKPSPRVDILENILCVLTEEQALLFSQRLKQCREKAIARQCQQEITILLNSSGLPRGLTIVDNVPLPKPTTYKAE